MSERDDIITELLVLYDEEREEHPRKEYAELLMSCTDEALAEAHKLVVANWIRQHSPVWMLSPGKRVDIPFPYHIPVKVMNA